MPAERTDIPENRRARHQSHAPALQDIDRGSRSTSGTPGLAANYNQRFDTPAASREHLAPAALFDTTFPGGSGHGSVPGNTNAHLNVLHGPGNIINSNPIMNIQSNSSAFINYAPVNNFVVPDINTPSFEDNKGRTLKDVMNLIGDRFISDALCDTQPKHAGCMSGTRESVLARIYLWIGQDPARIFWLAGMAGTGKTTIAVTLCRMLWDDPTVVLGGSFFCSRSAGSAARTAVRNILPTLAAALATQYPEFSVELAAGLKADPRAAQKPASDQLEVLLIKTFEKIAPLSCPVIFVIDGLDECTDEREVGELLTAIADLKINRTVKFVVTSRPEMHIRGSPISNPDHNTILQLHTIKEEEVTIDIRRYVTGTLKAASTATAPGASWYTENEVEILVKLSNGLFIFASTVLLYVLDKEQDRGRKERLHKVIHTACYGSAATSSLDKIYQMIVLEAVRSEKVDADELRATQRVLATILAARTPLSALALAELLDTDANDVRGSLERLHSVVYMPPDDTVPGVRALHASFGDYVISRAADRVRLPIALGDEVLAHGCLHVMSKCLRFNISQSDDSYRPNSWTKPHTISRSLEYACVEWIYHIAGAADTSVWDEGINTTFRVRFLFWLEVMSVLNKVRRAAAMLILAATTVRLTELANFLRDANTFVASSREAIEFNASHIYLSALPFAAKDSLVYQTFAPLCAGLISVEAIGVDQHGGRLMMTLTGHSHWVTSVDCSSDGRHVISGSYDGTVRIWDIRTGEEMIPPLDCGGGSIHSVAFAPNGKTFAASTHRGGIMIWSLSLAHANQQWQYPSATSKGSVKFSADGSLVASAFGDGIVRFWQVETGNIFTTLNCGHRPWFESVTFSPDGAKVASVSESPRIVQLWLVDTGEAVGIPLQANLQWHPSICFSPDGTKLAMTAQNGCIQVRDIDNWMVTATIRHGIRDFNHILFSPDGNSIASASSDGNVYLSTIPVEGTESPAAVFSGHTSSVRSATFSHDGLYIISCSDDCTIRVWDTRDSLKAVQTLSTHDDCISSVATASDGTFVVSGSHDRSVRVWNAHTGASRLAPLLGHNDAVLSVAISQDDRMIASASADKTVRLWDSRDGRAIGNPLSGHEDEVNSVGFSFDALWLASGSDDRTVRIWCLATGWPIIHNRLSCSGRVAAVAFSPDGRVIAASENTGRIHLWHAETGQSFCASLQSMGESVHSIAFSPDGNRIVSGDGRGRTIVWDVKTGQNLSATQSNTSHISSVIFSSDGTLTYSGSADDTVRVRDVLTGRLVTTLYCHDNAVTCVSLKPDGKSLVTCSADRSIRIWDLRAARSRSSAKRSDPATAVDSVVVDSGWLLSPTGSRLLWVPHDYRKYLQIWPCTMLIGERRVVVTIGSKGWHSGTSWTSCWLEHAWKAISRS